MILHLERKFTSSTETFIVNQINALDNYEHSVFTIEYLNLLETDAKVYFPEKTSFLSTKILKKSHKAYFGNQFKKVNPELIHSHYITDALVFRPFTKNLDLPKICSCYGYDVSVIPVRFKLVYKKYYQKIFEEYDMFLAMTEEMKKDLLEIGCPEKKIKVHYHGINTKQFDLRRNYEIRDQVFNLLTIASLYTVKGHLSVLKALAILVNQHPNIKFVYNIVGDGPIKNQLKNFVGKHGLSATIQFHGAVKHGPDFNDFLARADVFLHPSITTRQNDKEGIPGAVVEAMASGLPVVSTFHGGIPAVINDNKTGLLVRENDIEGITEKILSLYHSETLRKRIGKEAKKYAADQLDVFKKAEDLKKIYGSAILERRSKQTV